MPIFEYECKHCKIVWEETILFGDDPPTNCPDCHDESITKIISLPAAGKVKLYGQDFKNQMAKESKQLEQQIYKDENLLANFVGEKKYETNKKQFEKDSSDRPKIKSSSKK